MKQWIVELDISQTNRGREDGDKTDSMVVSANSSADARRIIQRKCDNWPGAKILRVMAAAKRASGGTTADYCRICRGPHIYGHAKNRRP